MHEEVKKNNKPKLGRMEKKVDICKSIKMGINRGNMPELGCISTVFTYI